MASTDPPTSPVPSRADQPGLGRVAKAQTDPAPFGHDDRLGPVPELSSTRRTVSKLPLRASNSYSED